MKISTMCHIFLLSILNLHISAMNKVCTSFQTQGSYNNFPLHHAALEGNLELLKKFLNANSITSKDDQSRTPLFYATSSGQAECVEAIFLTACSNIGVKKFEEISKISNQSAELLAEIITTEDAYQQSAYFCSQVSKSEKIKMLFQKAKQLLIQAKIWDENHNYCSIF